MIKQVWQTLRNRCTYTTLILGGVIAGLVVTGLLLAGGAYGLAWTNTEGFCISCHEMRNNPYAEYQDTIHDKNRSGVRAICSDCHVPREPGAMLVRKVEATFELWGHFVTGVIDTKEKYETHRYAMAKKVWTRMKKTDSLECRNCHIETKMSEELQSKKARTRHAKGRAEGLTCIDCHFGIAHSEPEGPGPRELVVKK